MDIDHLGDKTIQALLEMDLIGDVADIFYLTEEDIARLPGHKDKAIENLAAAIERAKDRPIDRLLYGLGIRHVGGTTARDIADALRIDRRASPRRRWMSCSKSKASAGS